MHLPPLVAFGLWIPIGILLFRRFPARIAILLNFFAGWGLLPGANYQYSSEYFPYWILGVSLPSQYFVTKATVISVTALAGWLIFCVSDARQLRPSWRDLPIVLWCCTPLITALSHGSPQTGGFAAAYQTLAWGVPWLFGRMYFTDDESLLLFAKACILAGVSYIPICLVEWITGPQLYHLVYGYQPYRLIGAGRYLGSRPVGFLEDGNQLGIWMAASALLAAALAVHHFADRISHLRIAWLAWALGIVTLLCQSAGSILLYLFLLPFTWLKRRSTARAVVVALIVVCALGALLLVAEHNSLRSIAQHSRFARFIAYGLERIGRRSFAWRLARDASHMSVALRQPLFGYGNWDWWRGGDTRPWSLWLLIFGMYGLLGLTASGALLSMPILRTVFSSAWHSRSQQFQLRLALCGLIMMVVLDNLLNGVMILPYLLAIAGMSGTMNFPQPQRSQPSARVARKQRAQLEPKLVAQCSLQVFSDESLPEHLQQSNSKAHP